jgi:hypothetical protein
LQDKHNDGKLSTGNRDNGKCCEDPLVKLVLHDLVAVQAAKGLSETPMHREDQEDLSKNRQDLSLLIRVTQIIHWEKEVYVCHSRPPEVCSKSFQDVCIYIYASSEEHCHNAEFGPRDCKHGGTETHPECLHALGESACLVSVGLVSCEFDDCSSIT